MAHQDPSLQELIVRALAGGDRSARQSLEAAAAADPELRSFCADLEDIVSTLMGARDWRALRPSPQLTARVREAVVAKLPSAPPHFRKVLLEADLGRRRAQRVFLAVIATAGLLAAFLAFFWLPSRVAGRALRLSGEYAYEAPAGGDPARDFEARGEGAWGWDERGLWNRGPGGPAALCLRAGYPAGEAFAFRLDLHVPELDDRSGAIIFLADAAGEEAPAFDGGERPLLGLTLEITRDGLTLYDADQALLASRPRSGPAASFFEVRMEHLGTRVRVLVNGEPFYAGAVTRAPAGPLHPGMRVAGPRKGGFRFNAVRVER